MSSNLEALRGRERERSWRKQGKRGGGLFGKDLFKHCNFSQACIHYCLWYLRPKPAEPSSDPSALQPVRRSDPETAWFGCLVCPKPDRWWEQRLPSKIRVPTD